MLRPESPALSTISAPRSPTVPTDPSAPRLPVSINKPPDAESVEGHRQRELKWVSLMSAVPPSHARKSKKVKKLLYEGVPSSVRYLVWSHLMDSRGKSVPTVYGQLAKRERVAAYHQIERDAQQSAFDHPNLAPTQTSLLSLLQSYLCMVPDITYSKGLTLIAGHLLLLAPEEDAFWIFVTLMDAYLRPYFSPNTTQLEVDAALFCRALESNDSQVAKKILTEIGIGAVELCRPWFTTLFVDALPSEYVNRVWDFFLCEGLPLLIRVGLAVIQCCRRAILECKTEESLLRYITAPPPTWFPPTVDAFITVVMSAKVKDDDVRKQRVKMEAQIKRQTQQGPRLQTNFISLPKP
ncbi:rab-GTPase-TBC domain-containing protein [Schizophyllum commune]